LIFVGFFTRICLSAGSVIVRSAVNAGVNF